VAVPIIALLVIFALVLWLGIRKGWFAGKRYQERGQASTDTPYNVVSEYTASNSHQAGYHGGLYRHDQPYEVPGAGIHQLYGEESSRR